MTDNLKQAQNAAAQATARAAKAAEAEEAAQKQAVLAMGDAAAAQAQEQLLRETIQEHEDTIRRAQAEKEQAAEVAEQAEQQLVELHRANGLLEIELGKYKEQSRVGIASVASVASMATRGGGGGRQGGSSHSQITSRPPFLPGGPGGFGRRNEGGRLYPPPSELDPVVGSSHELKFNYRMNRLKYSSGGKAVRFAGTTADVSGESVGEPWPEYWRIASYIGVNSNDEIITCNKSIPKCNDNDEFYNEYIANIWKPILKSEDRRYSGLLGYGDGDDKEYQKVLHQKILSQTAKQEAAKALTKSRARVKGFNSN